MVFQHFELFPHLNIRENLALAQVKVLKRSKDAAMEKGMALLDRVGLTAHAEKFPGQLSGGQQQRVAIARALAMNPKLVLLDEVTSALDPELVQEVLNTVKSIAEDGATLLIVTHEMRFARDVSSRVVFMEQGRIVEDGPPAQIFGAPRSARLADFLRNTRH